MSWRLLPARSAFATFAPEWDRLNRDIFGSHPYFDSRFVGPLLEFFGSGRELLCIHESSGQVDAALVLHKIGTGRWSLFLPSQAQAGPVLARDASVLESLFTALPGYAWSIDLLAIDPKYSPDWSRFHKPRMVHEHALTMAIAIDGDFDTYWQSRPRQLIKNIRRYRRRAEREFGTPSVVVVTGEQQIVAALTRYGQLEAAGWKGELGTAISIENVQGHFYAKVLRSLAASAQTRIVEIYFGDRLAASRLIVTGNGMWIILKTTYDESLATAAPGRLLLHEVLRQAFSEPSLKAVEFYTNATRDQAEWSTWLRYIRHVQLFRNSAVAAIHGVARSARATIRGRVIRNDDPDSSSPIPETVRSYSNVQEFPADTVALFEEHARHYVEMSADWFANLQQTVFPGDSNVRYYTLEFNGRPVAALPLRFAKHGWIRQIEALGNYYTSLYAPVMRPNGTALDLVAVLDQVTRDRPKTHAMRFAPMDVDAPSYEALLTALRSIGWIPFRFFCFGNWFLEVTGDWSRYLAKREGQLRSTIKRMSKKFSAEGGELMMVTESSKAEQGIRDFNSVYSRSWKKPEPYPQFVPGLIRWLAAKGMLRLGIAYLKGKPIAAQMWIVGDRKASIFKLAYDQAFSSLSPGTLLTAYLMEHVIERDGVLEVDYLIGDDAYKQSWMSGRRERWGIVAYNPRTFVGSALAAGEAAAAIGRKLLGKPHSSIDRNIGKSSSVTSSIDAVTKQIGLSKIGNGARIPSVATLQWRFLPATDFPSIASEWQALCDNTVRSPILSAEVVDCAIRHFGTGKELIALAAGPAGLIAATVLQRQNRFVWRTFQPSQLPLGLWLQHAQIDLSEIAQSLLRRLPFPALILSATQLDPEFYARPTGHGVSTLDFITTGRTLLGPDWDSFAQSGSFAANAKLASELARRTRKAERDYGPISLITEIDPEVAADRINRFADMESRGWKGSAGTALTVGGDQSRFYADMMTRLAKKGLARMYALMFGDTCAARQLAVEHGGTMILLKTTYEPEFRNLGPGVMQMQRLVQNIYERGSPTRIVEMYGRFNDSQKLWVGSTRVMYHANFYRFPILGSMHRHLTEARRRNQKDSGEQID